MSIISVEQARELLNQHRFQSVVEPVPLQQSLGRVLATDVHADRPLPPFDRVAMDGIAVSSADIEAGVRSFQRVGRQFAGEPALERAHQPRTCIETATGAILPQNYDTIVPYEALIESGDEFILREEVVVKPHQNVHVNGSDLATGERILPLGRTIDTTALTALASIGYAEVPVYSLPRTAVISTGDELVAVDQLPLPHQIRQSNAHTIKALLSPLGIAAEAFHLDDDQEEMHRWLNDHQQQFDLMLFSGGVSMGKRDFLPEVLAEIGLETHFHKVKQRPGKPLWFGSKAGLHVFGLPGNPVSTMLSVVLHVRPWIAACCGFGLQQTAHDVILGESFEFQPDLTLFQPVVIQYLAGKLTAFPVRGNGSGDYNSLINASGVIELPANSSRFERGQIVPYISFSWTRN